MIPSSRMAAMGPTRGANVCCGPGVLFTQDCGGPRRTRGVLSTYVATERARELEARVGERVARRWERAPASESPILARVSSPSVAILAKQLTSIALAALFTVGPMALNVPGASAVTNEQLLYLEAWRAVDRAYVDKTFNGQSWFKIREVTLKKKQLLSRDDTYAEIKGMLASLGDPFTRFLEPEQVTLVDRVMVGHAHGWDYQGATLIAPFIPRLSIPLTSRSLALNNSTRLSKVRHREEIWSGAGSRCHSGAARTPSRSTLYRLRQGGPRSGRESKQGT